MTNVDNNHSGGAAVAAGGDSRGQHKAWSHLIISQGRADVMGISTTWSTCLLSRLSWDFYYWAHQIIKMFVQSRTNHYWVIYLADPWSVIECL